MLKKLTAKVDIRLDDGGPLIHLLTSIIWTSKNISTSASLTKQNIRKPRGKTMVWKSEQNGWFHGHFHGSEPKKWPWTERRYSVYVFTSTSERPVPGPHHRTAHSEAQETQTRDHGLDLPSSSLFSMSSLALITDYTNYFTRILHLMRHTNT